MDSRLLGGWRHVAEDVRRLVSGLKGLPDVCACGHGSAHLGGMCPCCRDGERTLDSGCTDCEALLASLRDNMDELVDATLRFLPVVETTAGPEESRDVRDLRRRIVDVAAVFQRLETAADEFRQGCPSSSVPALRTLASELKVGTDDLDTRLHRAPEGQQALSSRMPPASRA